jgi:hypothetical protein
MRMSISLVASAFAVTICFSGCETIAEIIGAGTNKSADAEKALLLQDNVCSDAEKNLWINQYSFTMKNQVAWIGSIERFVSTMQKLYPILSRECAMCFAAHHSCRFLHCFVTCSSYGVSSDECHECLTAKDCNSNLVRCTGVSSASDLPPRRSEFVAGDDVSLNEESP